jgi:hypothetical protein
LFNRMFRRGRESDIGHDVVVEAVTDGQCRRIVSG